MSEPLVSVVVLNWNCGRFIQQCIDHILAQIYKNIEIIIVDNASTDGSLETLQKLHPEFQYVVNQSNQGFAHGMNQGIEIAKGEYLLLLNADAFIKEDFILESVQAMEQDDTIGSIAALIYSCANNVKTNIPRRGETAGFLLRKRMQGTCNNDYGSPTLVFGPPGSCPFLRKSALDDVKKCSGEYYDPCYFAHGEDLDLWYRLQLRNWKCLFTPRVIAWHFGSGSTDGHSNLFTKPLWLQQHILKNRYLTIIKDIPLSLLIFLSPYLLITELAIWPYFLIKSPKTIIALLGAYKRLFFILPQAINKRRMIQRNKSVTANYLKEFYVEF